MEGQDARGSGRSQGCRVGRFYSALRLLLTLYRHGLNFIKLDGDIGCLGSLTAVHSEILADSV